MAKTSGRKKKEPVSGTKKELVIQTRPAITRDQVEKDERKRRLLLVLKAMEDQGGIYERSLAHLVYWLQKEKDFDLGYNFYLVGDVPISKELHEDIVALLYVGLAETDPKTKKLRLTSDGKEFLETKGYDKEFYDKLQAAIDEYKPKIAAIDAQIELTTILSRPRAARRRRLF
ncbi:hypothetical protein [Hyperthermus butylicus]|uniref:Conserved crenarchaeal protein n=1 Tax=Hyperthermus butylicus (strain DSM 5456 / JCM 9403 / PLM1-5) TaxID=415426 RepID=A2BL32_HYPBU|nr:hypothetical protein [Hyperthermus butylicus]ABM80693.1 conserved crenarchaeal protein [Hyperthermus butylicus DSM 5456]